MKNLFLLFFSFVLTTLKAQDTCQCALNLNHFIEKVSINYAGFADKVNPKTRNSYNKLVDSLRQAATKTKDLSDCAAILEKYRVFFYDKHLQLNVNLPSSASSNAEVSKPPQTTWTASNLQTYFEKKKRKLKPIEGIWTTDGYKVGVVFDPKKKLYEAIVVSADNKAWKEGMLKFQAKHSKSATYEANYWRGNFMQDKVSFLVHKNYIEFERFGTWQKIFPTPKDTIAKIDFMTNYGGEVQWRMLDKNTLYVRLKSCDLANKAILDAFIQKDKEKLKTIPNWVVDFRGNSGGSTDVFKELLPYLYTKPFIEKGDKHLMTPENTAIFNSFFEANKAYFDAETSKFISEMLQFGFAHPNEWHDTGADTTTYKEVLEFPKRVAILSDKNNGSSGETFLIVAKGLSDKTLIFGENSGGYLDYGDLMPYRFPCPNISVAIPTRRGNYLDSGVSYDKTGFPPDVRIPEGTKDWVKFVFDYWERKKK